jgi:hypothetical protein
MLIVIYNDAAYGAEVHHFGPQGAALAIWCASQMSTSRRSGRALGLAGVTVRAPEDLRRGGGVADRGRAVRWSPTAKVVPTVVAALARRGIPRPLSHGTTPKHTTHTP